MLDQFRVCEHCGTKCGTDDKFCKVCFATLPEEVYQPIIEGIEDVDIINYIGKNSDYYLEKFAQKKKKWFIQLNWGALLFGPAWFFYRKMYKVAMIYSAALVLVSFLFTLIMPIAFQADVDYYFEVKGAFNTYTANYNNPDGRYHIYSEPEYREFSTNYKSAKKMIQKINLLIVVPVNVLNFAFRLLGNAFYKRHVTLNIHNGNNGVSKKSAILGWVGYTIAVNTASVVLLFVPAVLRFMQALSLI